MDSVWNASLHELEALRGIYIPSNWKELADVSTLVVETVSSVASLLKDRLNAELKDVEPVFLIAAVAFLFISAAWIRKLVTYDALHPHHIGSVHPGVASCLIDSPGSFSQSCGSTPPCVLCPFMHSASVLPNTDIPVFGRFECRSSNVVYLVHCTRCGMQYIGETGGELRQRFRGHLQLIREGKGALGEHFRSCLISESSPCRRASITANWKRARTPRPTEQVGDAYEDLSKIQVDMKFRPSMHVLAVQGGFWWDSSRKLAEKRWIAKLDTLSPNGLNRNRGTVPRTVWAKLCGWG